MKKEKSCGAVIFKKGAKIEYLLIKHKNGGHWGLCKGHVEDNETEKETALREIREETGIKSVSFMEGFKHIHSYSPKEGVIKDVVFFLCENLEDKEIVIQEEEVLGFSWDSYEDAYEKLTYENTKELLMKAEKFLSTEE